MSERRSDSDGSILPQLAHARHELRTPINAILGYSEMLMEDADAAGHADLAAAFQETNLLGRNLLERLNLMLADQAAQGKSLIQLGEKSRQELGPLCHQILSRGIELRKKLGDRQLSSLAPDLVNVLTAGQRFQGLLTSLFTGTESSHSPTAVATDQPTQESITGPHEEVDLSTLIEELDSFRGHILVVDDNRQNRDILARSLFRQKHHFALAAHGRQALEMIASKAFDLVLLDILMPEIDGFEVLARIKADPEVKHTPVIMISALDQIDSVVRCIEMGAEDYLPKPFNPTLLKARVGACLEKKHLRDLELEYLRNVAAVTNAAAAVETGQFDPDVLAPVADRTDQLGQLARVFQSMAREVKLREQRLQMQVQQLKVEIDHARKAEQVAEITGTDYFQDLQKKAQSLRNRKKP